MAAAVGHSAAHSHDSSPLLRPVSVRLFPAPGTSLGRRPGPCQAARRRQRWTVPVCLLVESIAGSLLLLSGSGGADGFRAAVPIQSQLRAATPGRDVARRDAADGNQVFHLVQPLSFGGGSQLRGPLHWT